jgi:hypothetical protein
MAGLDPAIRVPDTAPLEKRWITGSSPVMTFPNGANLRSAMISATEEEVTERERRYPQVEAGTMETRPAPDTAERAFWSWLGFWLEMIVLGVLALIGAFAASGADRPGDYACGMVLSLAAIALAFLRLKRRLDDGGSGWDDFLLVDDMWNLALVIPLFTLIGLAGLFVAHAWEEGAMHSAGIALFVVSGAIIFLDMKHVFDRMEPPWH